MTNRFLAAIVFLATGLQPLTAQDDFTDAQLLDFAKNRAAHVRITADPVWIEPSVATRCRAPTPSEVAKNNSNPHWQTAIHVFANSKGVSPLWDPYDRFPVGTILLKEKFRIDNVEMPELFTGMLKRKPGYMPEIGDWEFFTIDGALKEVTSRGRLESCIECHREYVTSNFVSKQYAALAGSDIAVYVDGKWRPTHGAIAPSSDDTIYLPARLAETHGPKLSRTAAVAAWFDAPFKKDSNAELRKEPDDLSPWGGPFLRYEPSQQKNTLGCWTNVEDTATWNADFRQSGKYRVSVFQGCGKGSGGSEVAVNIGQEKVTFTVEDTGHFQNFKWRDIGEVVVDAPAVQTVTVSPKTKPGVAVMDLRQIRLTRIRDAN